MHDKQKLYEFLKGEVLYLYLREIPGRGYCAIHRYLFTTGILYGLDFLGLQGRFCYETTLEAYLALELWTGEGDPPGNWIVNKDNRTGDRYNPNYIKTLIHES
jgi:hypothetical protein